MKLNGADGKYKWHIKWEGKKDWISIEIIVMRGWMESKRNDSYLHERDVKKLRNGKRQHMTNLSNKVFTSFKGGIF